MNKHDWALNPETGDWNCVHCHRVDTRVRPDLEGDCPGSVSAMIAKEIGESERWKLEHPEFTQGSWDNKQVRASLDYCHFHILTHANKDGREITVCEVFPIDDDGEIVSESGANARLIKRAPDMYRALLLAVRYLEHPEVKAMPWALPTQRVADEINEILKEIRFGDSK